MVLAWVVEYTKKLPQAPGDESSPSKQGSIL